MYLSSPLDAEKWLISHWPFHWIIWTSPYLIYCCPGQPPLIPCSNPDMILTGPMVLQMTSVDKRLSHSEKFLLRVESQISFGHSAYFPLRFQFHFPPLPCSLFSQPSQVHCQREQARRQLQESEFLLGSSPCGLLDVELRKEGRNRLRPHGGK